MKKREKYILDRIKTLEEESRKVARWERDTDDDILKKLWNRIFWEKRSAISAYKDVLNRLATKDWKIEES